MEQELFNDHETPLRLFAEGLALILAEFENPVYAVDELLKLLADAQLEVPQQAFVVNWLLDYISESEFDVGDLSTFQSILEIHVERLNLQTNGENPAPVMTTDLRKFLKDLIQQELKNLPGMLAGMKPKERLNYLLKLIPYALPRVESVYFREGEG
ncbi:MAG: hypothetical protein H6581_03910 [Bacteroidia bacterium]|nr:hypothetical protein [Bacteroidia bacterium]